MKIGKKSPQDFSHGHRYCHLSNFLLLQLKIVSHITTDCQLLDGKRKIGQNSGLPPALKSPFDYSPGFAEAIFA